MQEFKQKNPEFLQKGKKLVIKELNLEVKIVTRSALIVSWQTNKTIDLPRSGCHLHCVFILMRLNKIEVFYLVNPFLHQSISMHILTMILNPP